MSLTIGSARSSLIWTARLAGSAGGHPRHAFPPRVCHCQQPPYFIAMVLMLAAAITEQLSEALKEPPRREAG